jgi:signal transduction histidine kinase
MNNTVPNGLYAGLTVDQLRVAETIGAIATFDAGDEIFHEGDSGDCMYVVRCGSVEITKTVTGSTPLRLDLIESGDYFGEMCLVDNQPRSANAIAQELTELRVLRRKDLGKLMSAAPQTVLTLLKTSSQRLRQMNTQYINQILLQAKLSLIGQMAGSIIHDFKNPITVIQMQAEMLMCKRNDKEIRTVCTSIIQNVDRMTSMANDLMDFAHGKTTVDAHPTKPGPWIADLAEMLKPMLESNHVSFQQELLTDLSLTIDVHKMTRVLYNLATNAIQAMPSGGSLTIRIEHQDDEFHIDIVDTGPGIPEQIRDRLFDMFVTYGKANGTGLGTAIAKKTVEEHGGKISFITRSGIGTTFHIQLPVVVRVVDVTSDEAVSAGVV